MGASRGSFGDARAPTAIRPPAHVLVATPSRSAAAPVPQAPWSTKWFGKLAKSGAWSNKFRVPFQKSINITYRAGPGQPASDVIYMIVRGAENLPITIGGVTLPTTARMNLQVRGSAGGGRRG